jgi:competence protein ComEA
MNKTILVTTVVVVGLCVRIRSLGPEPAREFTHSWGQETAAAEPPEPFVRVCGKCHDAARIIQGRRFREQWEETLDKMVTKGAKGSDEDFDAILSFLMSAFGRVNVNAAPAEDIGSVLHLESSQADAIVRFREQHGKFADFDALSKVPGANVDALRKARDAIVF